MAPNEADDLTELAATVSPRSIEDTVKTASSTRGRTDLFTAVDRYIDELFVPPDRALDEAIQSSVAAGLPQIHVSPAQGKLLYLFARLTGARRILELGTLAGYSTIWMARALPPGGRLLSLEVNAKHAALATSNLARAGVADRVEILVGPALDTLRRLHERQEPPFDMVFIDADKPNYPGYLEWTLRLTRPGSLILADNVIRAGAVLAPDAVDENAVGAHAFNAALAADSRIDATILQLVGQKGHDGLAIAVVR
jgi:predicted O-methyltransferase YrrM